MATTESKRSAFGVQLPSSQQSTISNQPLNILDHLASRFRSLLVRGENGGRR